MVRCEACTGDMAWMVIAHSTLGERGCRPLARVVDGDNQEFEDPLGMSDARATTGDKIGPPRACVHKATRNDNDGPRESYREERQQPSDRRRGRVDEVDVGHP